MKNIAIRVPRDVEDFLNKKTNISIYIRALIYEDMVKKNDHKCCEELLKIKDKLKNIIKEE